MATNPFEELDTVLERDEDEDALFGDLTDESTDPGENLGQDDSGEGEEEGNEGTEKTDPKTETADKKEDPKPVDKKDKAKTEPAQPKAGTKPEKVSPFTQLFNVMKDVEAIDIDDELAPEATVDDFKKVLEKQKESIAKKAIDKYFEGIDETRRKDIEFIKNGGDIAELKATRAINWNAYKPEQIAKSPEASKVVLRNFYKARGVADTDVESRIAKLEKAEMLGDEAADALKELQTVQTAKEAELYKAAQEKSEKDNTDTKRIRDLILTTVREGKIENFDIPKKVRQDLEKYITEVDSEGRTKQQVKEASMTDEQKVSRRLFLSLLEMVNFDFTQMANITKSKSTESLASALQSLANSGVSLKASSASPGKQSSKDDDDVLDDLANNY